jgi:hypothetical protein
LGKKYYNSGKNLFSLTVQIYNYFQFLIFVATENDRMKENFSPSSFGAVVGSGMDKN